MPKKLKVIFFDAGGTLFRPYPSIGDVYAMTAAHHGVHIPAVDLEARFHKAWHHRNSLASLSSAASEKIEREWWYALVQEVFQRESFQSFDRFFEDLFDRFARSEHWRLFDDSLVTLERLRKEGYRLGIISNWDRRLLSIVEQLGLVPYFETIVASSIVGVAKPSKEIFQHALEAMAISPEEALHIGDSVEDDYQGARRAGLRAVLLDRHGKAYNGVVRIGSLDALDPLLNE